MNLLSLTGPDGRVAIINLDNVIDIYESARCDGHIIFRFVSGYKVVSVKNNSEEAQKTIKSILQTYSNGK